MNGNESSCSDDSDHQIRKINPTELGKIGEKFQLSSADPYALPNPCWCPYCPYLKQSLRLNLNKIFGQFLCQTSCCVFVLPVIPSLVVLQDLHRSNRSKDLRRMRRLQWNKNKTPNVLPVGPPLISVDRWSMCYRWAGQDHSGDSYREGLQEVRSHAEHIRGSNIAPKFWIKLTILVRSVG